MNPNSDNAKRTFALLGMSCQGCARTIQSALERQPGVRSVKVSYIKKLAEVDGDIRDDAVERAVREIGYRGVPTGGAGRA